MENRAETIELIHDLIQVNEDRSEGYTHVSESLEIKDPKSIDLQCVFSNFAANSMRYTSMLKDALFNIGGIGAETVSGDKAIEKDMQHVKDSFKGYDKESILTSCEAGERATLSVFKKILDKNILPSEIRELIRTQQDMLLHAYQYINEYRNALVKNESEVHALSF